MSNSPRQVDAVRNAFAFFSLIAARCAEPARYFELSRDKYVSALEFSIAHMGLNDVIARAPGGTAIT